MYLDELDFKLDDIGIPVFGESDQNGDIANLINKTIIDEGMEYG